MEGTLEIWQGVMGIGGWTKKYFVLTDSILVCCDKKGGDVEAKLHLKVATLDPRAERKKQFLIYTGINRFKLRAATDELKGKWLEAL